MTPITLLIYTVTYTFTNKLEIIQTLYTNGGKDGYDGRWGEGGGVCG